MTDGKMTVFRVYEQAGPDGYPPEWHSTIKHLTRDQAGNRCERCGHPYRNGEHGTGEWSPCDKGCTHGGPLQGARGIVLVDGVLQARWRVLTVHHLNGVKLDCRWWNLAALCQRCHLRIQRRVNMAQVWQHEHSPWFKPHAAGYYAAVYLGEDLQRDETLARLDELLALEYVA